MTPNPAGRDDRYVQRLPGVDVTLERATERTPDKTRYHVFDGDRLVASYKRVKDAQAVFREVALKRGWRPTEPTEKDAGDILAREKEARDRAAYEEYWGSATSYRRAGRPKRRQR